MDEKPARPEAPKKERGNHWLLWWKIEPEELQKNIVEYDTLRIYQSARGISFLLLLLSGIADVVSVCVGYKDAWILSDAILLLGLAAFIYRGHRWAMLVAMVFWTLEKAFQIYSLANMPAGSSAGYLIVTLGWWAVYMHAFYFAFIVEKKRSIRTAVT
jgi:hypothetical protein